jgi:hypothetical protein
VNEEGPQLEHLTRRLAEAPAEVLAEPRIGKRGRVVVAAVVSDLLSDLGGQPLRAGEAALFDRLPRRDHKNWLRTVLVASWLLHDEWFRTRGDLAGATLAFLNWGLSDLASAVPAGQLVSDPDRREEFARLALKGLRLRPGGETPEQAEDRLAALDSVERQRLIQQTLAAEENVRRLRETAGAQDNATLTRYAPP